MALNNNGPKRPPRLLLSILIIFISWELVQAATVTVYPGENIQAAIDNASPGDIIEVKSGNYTGNIEIDKHLVVRGMGTPVVQACSSGSTINVSANGCIVEGFKIINSSGWHQGGIRLTSNDNIIKNNDVADNNLGIIAIDSDGNTISRNDARNDGMGILLLSSSNNTIEGNRASSRGRSDFGVSFSIYLLDSCNHNKLRGNTIDISGPMNMGILIAQSKGNTVIDNEIKGSGLFSGMGIALLESDNCLIENNTAVSNGIFGQGIRLMSSRENTIKDNNATCNGPMGQAIAILQSDHNAILDNKLKSWLWGVDMEFEGSWSNRLSGNNAVRIGNHP